MSKSTSLPDAIPSLSYSGDGVGRDNVFRSREISASRLDRSTLSTLGSRGFTTIKSASTDLLGTGLVARLQTPSNVSADEALDLARRLAPQSIFDFSHLYGPSDGKATYARSLIKLPQQGGCVTSTRIGLIDSRVASHDSLKTPISFREHTGKEKARPSWRGDERAGLVFTEVKITIIKSLINTHNLS